ncbi:exopolysaccharide biosynthesis polyprenyl glycosylphosphotransferase [Kozakia baliensis]|uniref:exopolysaccharide biosynthesis polyprenyl glycosylphosphotransferase n=1 Tax=Kozakia baliensis TaxID=153496 RepID=UPI00345C5EFD
MSKPMPSPLTKAAHILHAFTDAEMPPAEASPDSVAGRQLIVDPYPYFNPVLSKIFSFCDLLSVILASSVWYLEVMTWSPRVRPETVAVSGMVAVITFVLLPRKRNLMNYPRVQRISAQLRYISPALFLAVLTQFIALRVLDMSNTRAFDMALFWLALCIGALVLVRGTETILLHTRAIQNHLTRKIAIIGTGDVADQLADRIDNDAGHTYQLLGRFNDAPRSSRNSKITGTINDLVALSRRHSIHAVIIALAPGSTQDEHEINHLAWRLRTVLSDIYIAPYLLHGVDTNLPVENLGPHSLFVLQRRPLSELQTIQKSAFDFVFGLIVLAFLWPLLLAVAIAIKLDSKGPVFFRQPRIGFNNRPFTVFKFRSMYTEMSDLGAAKQTSRDDPRVTRIGKWLRKLSIDELPQIFNVLTGSMSLVGPRPHAPHTTAGGILLHDALAEYVIRHHVKPGITGWAQINGSRGELITVDDLKRRVALDLEYIQKWSLRFDIKIMALTVVREVFSRNAF